MRGGGIRELAVVCRLPSAVCRLPSALYSPLAAAIEVARIWVPQGRRKVVRDQEFGRVVKGVVIAWTHLTRGGVFS